MTLAIQADNALANTQMKIIFMKILWIIIIYILACPYISCLIPRVIIFLNGAITEIYMIMQRHFNV